MKVAILAILSLIQIAQAAPIMPAQARAQNRDCFQAHLNEALATNRERREEYARLSDGKSRKVTRQLILAEKVGVLIMAKQFDSRAKKFQQKGMTIVCDELLSPRSVPEFQAYTEIVGENPEKFISVNPKALKRTLKQASRKKDMQEVARIAEATLVDLMKRPSFNCLIRNDVTTILKTARLLQKHEKMSGAQDLEEVRKLSYDLLDRVIGILPLVESLDKMAFPLQKKGIAMICQDFPEARPRASYAAGSAIDL